MKKILLFILLITILTSCFKRDDEAYNKLKAYNYSKEFVKDKLKVPSTAVFPKVLEKSKHTSVLSDTSFYIKSWVDSENTFGGVVRTKFSCTIIISGDIVYTKGVLLY